MTHRQFLAWQTFDNIDYELPSRSDLYTMQLTDVASQISLLSPKGGRTYDGNRWLIRTKKRTAAQEQKVKSREEWIRESREEEKRFVGMFGS